MAAILVVLLIIEAAFGAAGAWIASQRGRSPWAGFFLGIFLNGAGLVITALLPKPIDFQVQEALVVQHALSEYQRTGRAPVVGQQVIGPATVQPTSANPALSLNTTLSLPAIAWNQVLTIISGMSLGPDEPYTSAVNSLKNMAAPCAWCLGSGLNKEPVIAFFFHLKVLHIECSAPIPSMSYFHRGTDPIASVIYLPGGEVQIELKQRPSSTRVYYVCSARPEGEAATFIRALKDCGWVAISVLGSNGSEPRSKICEDTVPRNVDGQSHSELQTVVAVQQDGDSTPIVPLVPNELHQKLETLKRLRTADLISDEEYSQRKSAILDQYV